MGLVAGHWVEKEVRWEGGGYPTNMIVQVTWPGGSSSALECPRQACIARGPPPMGGHLCLAVTGWEQEPHLWWHVSDPLEVRQSALWGRGGQVAKKPHKLISNDFSLQRQPPPASCRDGPVQPHSLQLEMEGSRWPCLAQIPARLPGRCGRRDRVGASSGNIGEEGGSHLLAILVGPCLHGGGGQWRPLHCGSRTSRCSELSRVRASVLRKDVDGYIPSTQPLAGPGRSVVVVFHSYFILFF